MAHVKYPNEDTYLGEYKYGKRHGKGQYKYKNGEIYSGEFINDMKHGIGHIIKEGEVINSGNIPYHYRNMGRRYFHRGQKRK